MPSALRPEKKPHSDTPRHRYEGEFGLLSNPNLSAGLGTCSEPGSTAARPLRLFVITAWPPGFPRWRKWTAASAREREHLAPQLLTYPKPEREIHATEET